MEDFDDALAAHQAELRAIYEAHHAAMTAVYASKKLSRKGKKAAIQVNIRQFSTALAAWHHRNLVLYGAIQNSARFIATSDISSPRWVN